MAPPAWERGSQGVEKSTPGGPKKGSLSPPGGSQTGFRSPLGRLGRQVGLRRALWAEKAELGKLHGRLLGPSLGPLCVSWARFGSICPPRGGSGEGPGGHF